MEAYLKKNIIQAIICSVIMIILFCSKEAPMVLLLRAYMLKNIDIKVLYEQAVMMIQAIL